LHARAAIIPVAAVELEIGAVDEKVVTPNAR
jgi:hypothetical protein